MNHSVGFVGLGRMGKSMVLHLLEQGVGVVAYNRTKEVTQALVTEYNGPNLMPAYDLKELTAKLPAPRTVWVMVPNGKVVDDVIAQLLAAGVASGDTIIDGGNTFYKDTVVRATALTAKGIQYIDCGTSGGLAGARTGACLMLGGEEGVVSSLSWLWDMLALPGGWNYFGTAGAGHFVKMVHNAIEYGMNEALGEGMEVLSKSPYNLNLAKVAATWQQGSIVRGFLLDLLAKALTEDTDLTGYSGKVGAGETDARTFEDIRALGVDASAISAAVEARKKAQTTPTFASKVVSALRRGYGGHNETTAK